MRPSVTAINIVAETAIRTASEFPAPSSFETLVLSHTTQLIVSLFCYYAFTACQHYDLMK